MSNNNNKVSVHVLFPEKEHAELKEYTEAKFPNLRAMSQVIRNFVKEGLARAKKKG